MEFFDKKKDVIDLKLTRYGKQLLSLGRLEPTYYAFSDDGVIYDTRWVTSGTLTPAPKEDQWLVERRIQEETPRIKTLNSKVGAERTIFNTANLSDYALEKNIIDLFNLGNDLQDLKELDEYKNSKVLLDDDFAESENLMPNLLGSKRYFNNKAPAWNMLFYSGEISSSFKYYQTKDLFQFVPQINANIVDKGYKVPFGYDLAKIPGYAADDPDPTDAAGEHHAGEHFIEYDFEAGAYILEKGSLFLSVEEAHVDFNRENFVLEVFEVTEVQKQGSTEKEERLTILFFAKASLSGIGITSDSVENLFNVEFDGEISQELACGMINRNQKVKTQNIYTSDIFDCDDVDDMNTRTSNNPYDLPPVDIEDC